MWTTFHLSFKSVLYHFKVGGIIESPTVVNKQ